MSGITQTIPAYTGGISEQPDQLKVPGQVKSIQNGIPDLVKGLYKRPGSKRLGTVPLTNVQAGGSWFHYYRDETEGSYIGQVAADGKVRVWSCNDGTEKNVWYATDNSAYNGGTASHASITSYLTPSTVDGVSQTEDIQTLTINDTTFLNNRSKVVATTGTTDGRPHKNFAYIQLLRTENGRQYGLNIYDSDTTSIIKTATRIKVDGHELGTGARSGQCKGIGTKVYSAAETNTGSQKNLTFRISVSGQQGIKDGEGGDTSGTSKWAGTYTIDLVLLHGGEDWETNDDSVVAGPSGQGKYDSGTDPQTYNSSPNFTIRVTEHEEVAVKANIKAVRPAPTPFDSDTSVTVDAILGGISGELAGVTVNGNALNYKIVGSGIYLYTAADADDFNVEVVNQDLMRVMAKEINSVEDLPIQCVHNTIVKIANTRNSEQDDYYVKFNGENGQDGYGSWIECAAPGIEKSFDADTMPHVLQRQPDGDFLVKKYTWTDRTVGDNNTNQIPSFVGQTINKVLFFRNRLAILSGENVVTSRTGTIAEPNFWSETALTVSVNDPVDIACASLYPSDLYDAIEITTGLLCFSTNAQFLLASDETTFNPDTAKLRAVSWYNYDKIIAPISLGRTVGFLDNSNKYSRFMETANVNREGAPIVQNTSELVPSLLPKDLDLLTNSKENNLVFFGKTDSDTVIGYKYLRIGNDQQQSAWFKWKFNNPIKYHFCINDQYYLLDTDNFLQSVNIVQEDADPSIDQDGTNYLIHLDNYTTVSGGTYSSTTNLTTFTNQSTWIPNVTTPNGKLVLVDIDSNTTREGRYAECTLTGNSPNDDFTVPGDWSSATLYIGYLYDYQIDFPRFYLQKSEGGSTKSDVNSKLTVHRMKLNFGKIGLYETTLTRVGKDPYTEVYESTDLDEYDASDAPYLAEKIKDIPVYERNVNVDVVLKSAHPAPATLRSMSWEGDWSPMHYRRV